MNDKKIKLYNLIFPVYMLWLMPPVFFIAAILNFIIDSIVVLVTEKFLKLHKIFSKYKKVILKVWLFGFIADFIGALFLFLMSFLFENLNIPIKYNIDYNPFGNIYALIITILGILIAGILIFIFNRKICFKNIDITEKQKFILSLVIAIVTTPYLFLLPMEIIW